MKHTKTSPPGRVTRSISRTMRSGSATCSSTFEEKHTSTTSSRTGNACASPHTSPMGRRSTDTYRAPAAPNAAAKNPGPPPTSSTRNPGTATWRPTSATESAASGS